MEAAAPTVFMVWLRDCCQPKFFIACFYFCQVSFCSTPEPFEDQTYCILRIKIQFIPHTIQCNSYRLVDGSVRMNSLFIARVIRSYGYEKSKSQERLAFTSSSTQNLRSNTVPWTVTIEIRRCNSLTWDSCDSIDLKKICILRIVCIKRSKTIFSSKIFILYNTEQWGIRRLQEMMMYLEMCSSYWEKVVWKYWQN